VRLEDLSREQILRAASAVRRSLRAAENAALGGDHLAAYSHAEAAQEAAFEFRQLFALTDEEIALTDEEIAAASRYGTGS
jgi:hypothetical protein